MITLRPLPRRVQLAELGPADLQRPTLGVGGDGAEPIRLDLFASPGTFLVAGPPRSGRTTVLTVLGKQLESANIEVLVAAPARSATRALRSTRRVLLSTTLMQARILFRSRRADEE